MKLTFTADSSVQLLSVTDMLDETGYSFASSSSKWGTCITTSNHMFTALWTGVSQIIKTFRKANTKRTNVQQMLKRRNEKKLLTRHEHETDLLRDNIPVSLASKWQQRPDAKTKTTLLRCLQPFALPFSNKLPCSLYNIYIFICFVPPNYTVFTSYLNLL